MLKFGLLQDGFEQLDLPGEALRGRIRIQYVDSFGEVEAGVDGGGLFKDFMEHLIREGFDPQVGTSLPGEPVKADTPDDPVSVLAVLQIVRRYLQGLMSRPELAQKCASCAGCRLLRILCS